MKVRIVCPALTVLGREKSRMTVLAEFGFTVEVKTTSEGAEYLKCQDSLEKEMTLETLTALLASAKLVATVFPDGVISLESA